MRKYDIYGIGNALVDSEFRVDERELASLNVEKGTMTLIDADRRAELLRGLGELPGKRASGGSAANSMIAASQMGARCFYSCKVAPDELGEFYLRDLRACAVESNEHHSDPDGHSTGTCLVLITPDAERSMSTYLGATADISSAELVMDALVKSSYFYIEGYLAASPTGRRAVTVARQAARDAGVKIALTLSDVNMIRFCRDGLDELWSDGVDLLFSNEEEAKLMFGVEDVRNVVEPLQQRTKSFVITRGKEGALVWDGQRVVEVAAAPVKPLDTNGAGDMFAGAVLSCLTRGLNLVAAAKLGTLAAGELIQHFGPRLPSEVTSKIHRDFLGRLVYP
ncbi:MAG: adenosine kinase [Pirellulaceae bacterium]|nr:adenosine kinase [Pirellulaceae bacterium]